MNRTTRTHRIGIMGPANAGKDTVAILLSEATGYPVVHFSDALYQEVSAAFRIPEERLRDRRTKEQPSPWLILTRCNDRVFRNLTTGTHGMQLSPYAPRSPRQILEWWGTDYRRAADPDYWVRQVAEKDGPLIIPDVRFQNEADMCTRLIRVLRPGHHILRNHASDQLWRNHEGTPTILNHGTIEDLRGALCGYVKS